MRKRGNFLYSGGIVAFILLLLVDPDGGLIQNLPFGAGTVATLSLVYSAVLYIGLIHFSRKAIFDYLDLELLVNKAKETPQGAGMVVIGIGLYYIAAAIAVLAAVS